MHAVIGQHDEQIPDADRAVIVEIRGTRVVTHPPVAQHFKQIDDIHDMIAVGVAGAVPMIEKRGRFGETCGRDLDRRRASANTPTWPAEGRATWPLVAS